MFTSEKPTALISTFQKKLAVIEVNDGETQEEAWCRFLITNPKYAKVPIRIFHYPAKDSLNKRKGQKNPKDQVGVLLLQEK